MLLAVLVGPFDEMWPRTWECTVLCWSPGRVIMEPVNLITAFGALSI